MRQSLYVNQADMGEGFRRVRVQRLGRLMGDLYSVRSTGGRVAVLTGFGLGAPIVAAQAEELIALGARQIVSIALAGGLQPDLPPGSDRRAMEIAQASIPGPEKGRRGDDQTAGPGGAAKQGSVR